MIGTRILKIDLKIAEIIVDKVGNHHLEINILLAISKSIFKILVPIMYQIS